jgi:hypothetical protein
MWEVTEIDLHASSINQEDRCSVSRSWKHCIDSLKQRGGMLHGWNILVLRRDSHLQPIGACHIYQSHSVMLVMTTDGHNR